MATRILRPEQHKFFHSGKSSGEDNSLDGNTSRDWGSQEIEDESLNLSNASSVFENSKPADGKRKKESWKLLRQNAEEQYCRLESGFGSSGSLEFCSVSEHGSFEANSINHHQHPVVNGENSSQILLNLPDATTIRQCSQTSSGFGDCEYLRTDSRHENGRDFLSVPRFVDRQISQASSGYGEGENLSSAASRRRFLFSDKSDGKDSFEGSTSRDWDSQDIEDPLNLSNASSVFGSENSKPADLVCGEKPKPIWKEDCEALELELEQELINSAVVNVLSVSELEGKHFQDCLHSRIDNNNNDNKVSRTKSAAVSIQLIPPNHLSAVQLQISNSDKALTDNFVWGPAFDENMHLMRDAPQPERNEYCEDNSHEALEPAANVTTTTSHLEWAHHCGSLVAGNPVKMCPLADCTEAKCFLGWLDKCFHLGHLPDCNRCVGTLGKVLCHSRSCPESHCSLPFCQLVQKRRQVLGRHLSVEELKGEVSSFGKLSAMEAMSSSIHPRLGHQLDHTLPAHALPLAFLGNFGKFNVLLARLRRQDAPPSQSSTVVIKKLPRRDRLLPALQIIRGLSHDCLLRVMDVIEKESHLVVLSDFVRGMTFHEMVIQREGHWPWQDHFSAVVEAVSYLHQQNILFLNWECENILLRSTPQVMGQESPCLVITQGSLSLIPRGSDSFQVDEALLRAVSPRIAAPEILALGEVGYSADIWGLGVLLYQLTKREKPYNNLRHYTWPRAREEILQNKQPPNLKGCDLWYIEVLRQSLSWRREDRPSLHTFKELFINSRIKFEQ